MSWKKKSDLPTEKESQIIDAYLKPSYGIYVVSSASDRGKAAYLANCVFQVSAFPPLFAFCSNHDNDTTKHIEESQKFAISVMTQALSKEQITTFGYTHSDQNNKFDQVEHIIQEDIPIVTENCNAWFLCKVEKSMDIGTHQLYIGSIIDYALSDTDIESLTYAQYQAMKHGFSPKNSPTHIKLHKEEPKKEETPKEDTNQPKTKPKQMRCEICGYVYDESDPEHEHTFDELSGEWTCPVCNAPKDDFVEI
ncbi:flavin reductase [Halosquirtibacter laminarini]|uniref:Flavin reductase n=1 Tax=Halosquirtibacter laminarini TaxID=3374600 RepID=A0AC61NNY3_9BACT|nr:flavin reductase [Prolixibacteraceae bacterium]